MAQSFRTLLVPLDGSSLAEVALPYVEWLGVRLEAEVVLVRSALAHTAPGLTCASSQVQVVSEAEEYLAVHEARLRAGGIRCRSVVPYGPAAPSILDNAGLQRADLVVMSAHGRSGESRWAHGGVADKVVEGLSIPVLLVQGPTPPNGGRSRVLLPLDGSDAAEALLPGVADLAARLEVEVVLLVVVCHPSQSGRDYAAEARDYLERVCAWLAARGVAATAEVRVGSPAEEILDRSDREDIWFLALSSHGRSGVGRWAYGSVADKVLHQTERTVLFFRSPGAQPHQHCQTRARRCHNCGREVYRQTFSAADLCPLCGFTLRACANCASYDGVVCLMGNPWSRSIEAGTHCPDFEFRETLATSASSLGR